MADGYGPGRVPPSDHRAEQAVLSAALISEDAALLVVEQLTDDDFFADPHRRIFEAIRSVARSGTRVDVVSVHAALRDAKRLDQIGGSPALAELADGTPSIGNLPDHIRMVAQLGRVRRTLRQLQLLVAKGYQCTLEGVDAYLGEAEASVLSATLERSAGASTVSTYRELAADVYRDIERAAHAAADGGPRVCGLTTGLRALDEHLDGLEGGDLWVIGGRPGAGKSALGQQIVEAVAGDASQARACIYLALEMQRKQLMRRSYARATGISVRDLKRGNLENEDWPKLTRAVNWFSSLPIAIDDAPRLSPGRIAAKVRRHRAELARQYPNAPLGLIVLDHLQLTHPDAGGRKNDTRVNEIGAVTAMAKEMAKQLNVTVIALSQLSRPEKGKEDVPPTMRDLRDSGAIEQDADNILLLHRRKAKGEEPVREADCIIGKARNEETGTHHLGWDGRRARFTDEVPS